MRYLGMNRVPVGGFAWHDEKIAKARSEHPDQNLLDMGVGSDLAPTDEDKYVMSCVIAEGVVNGVIKIGGSGVDLSICGRRVRCYVIWLSEKDRMEVGTRKDFATLGECWLRAVDVIDASCQKK